MRHEMGFTHIELLPVSEHPFTGSWGYQPIGLFAPTSRFGSPEDFASFRRRVPSGGHRRHRRLGAGALSRRMRTGSARFDGTALYEHEDPRLGFHRDWNTLIYNFGRREVANFLQANALYWLEQFHIDALRVDAVASMLYLDYSRNAGEWVPERPWRRENLDAIAFLRDLNTRVFGDHPGATTMAEESTAWPQVSRPVDMGGLGFGYKWNMGWMHDTLEYMHQEPVHRRFHHHQLTFGLALRLLGKLRPAAQPRRGRARQGFAARQDAGRPLAEVRQSARLFRLHVDASRQEAPVHGRRVRRRSGNGTTTSRSTGTCSTIRCIAASRRSCATSTVSTASVPALHVRDVRSGRLRVDQRLRRGPERARLPAQGRGGRCAGPRRLQLHAGAYATITDLACRLQGAGQSG